VGGAELDVSVAGRTVAPGRAVGGPEEIAARAVLPDRDDGSYRTGAETAAGGGTTATHAGTF
jgi:hypothetical protein